MTTDKIKQLSDSRSPPKRFKFKLRKILMSKADKQCKKCSLKLLDFQKDLAIVRYIWIVIYDVKFKLSRIKAQYAELLIQLSD